MTPEHILDIERRRLEAMRSGDVEVLRHLLHEALVYLHSSGRCDSQESYLHAIAAGAVRYLHIADTEMAVTMVGSDAAVVLGVMDAQIASRGVTRAVYGRYCATWLRVGGDWRLVSCSNVPIERP